MKKKVLFVCSSNVCRSAVAAAILIEYGHQLYDVSSAGISARSGDPMQPQCAEALEEIFGHGYSAYNHSSIRMTYRMLLNADVIVAATNEHAEYLRSEYKEVADKVTTFPKPVYNIACLRGDSMVRAVKGIRDQVFQMFLEDGAHA